ncbi:spinster family MFS transporter [Brevundimonas sp. Root1279]|uniref:spinster family MFS transporter n=1 Tax=Brevundimonas sp. Root1279 TaxID=1736443 RepID=UPI0006FF2B6A|nr:MFS transporter [Brevundimonas sp. Root1279]KQW86686.1 MFS transporter [Brevundimonas sp. Root1279]
MTASVHPQNPAAPIHARPGARAWFVLTVLCFVYVLNFLDRQLLSILAKPIQDELGVTDGQLGMISGLYFALFYCILAIPVGWLADRTNRVKVLAASCALWSAATAACGLSNNYGQLAMSRMAVGVGEAGGVPPSYAIISDYFPSGTRGTALSLFNLGPPIGQALGVAFGASIAAAYSWRDAFVWVGIIGVFTAAVVWLFVREPKKGGLDQVEAPAAADAAPVAKVGFWSTCRMYFGNPVLRGMALACGATQFITYATLNFATLFLMREKGMTLQEIAVWYALLVGVCVSIGMFLSGRLIDRLARRSKTAYAWLPAIGLLIGAPFFAGFVWAPTWQISLLFLAVPMALNYFYLSPAVTLVQEEVRPNQRVLSGALLLLVMNLIGLGLGPTFVGAASDFFKADYPDNSLQMAFYTLLPFYGLAIAMFLGLAAKIRRQAAKEAAQ